MNVIAKQKATRYVGMKNVLNAELQNKCNKTKQNKASKKLAIKPPTKKDKVKAIKSHNKRRKWACR